MNTGLLGAAASIKADANKQRSAAASEETDWEAMAATRRSVREYLDTLDEAPWGAASEVRPKFISKSDPAAQWTGALKGHAFFVTGVRFSPDGRRIVTAGWDNLAKVWDAESGQGLLTLKGHTDRVYSVGFSPDGRRIVTGSFDKTARLWKIPQPVRGDPERILLWAQVITGLELDEHGVVRALDADTWQQRRQRLQELGGPPEM